MIGLSGCTHAAADHQQNASAQNQDAADHIEDRGARAAGGGQLGAGLVDYDLCGSGKILDRNSNGMSRILLSINLIAILVQIDGSTRGGRISFGGSNRLRGGQACCSPWEPPVSVML